MTCHKVQDLITPYLDNRLSGEVMLEVKSHISVCQHCAEEYELLRQVRLLLGSLRVHQPSASAECRFVQLMDDSLKTSRFANRGAVPGQFMSVTTFVFSTGSVIARQQAIAAQRSRRLAAAAAISAFGILIIASPFGPDVSNLSARAFDKSGNSSASMLSVVPIPGEVPVDLASLTVAPKASPVALEYGSQQASSSRSNADQYDPANSTVNDQRPDNSSVVIDQRPFSTNITFASFPLQ